jgi:hypothetical protein
VLAVLLVVEVRVVRAAFAASPRVAAAPADAEREAGVRFDAGLGTSAAVVSDAAAPLRPAVAVFVAAAFAAAVLAAAADFAALVRDELERDELAGFDVVGVSSAVGCGVESVDTCLDSSVGLLFTAALVVRGFAAFVFAALDFAAAVFFAAPDFAAAVFFAAPDFAAAVRGLGGRPPACAGRDTRWSDTPVPVPSAASSS